MEGEREPLVRACLPALDKQLIWYVAGVIIVVIPSGEVDGMVVLPDEKGVLYGESGKNGIMADDCDSHQSLPLIHTYMSCFDG